MLNPKLLDKNRIYSCDNKGYLIYTTIDGDIKIKNERNILYSDEYKKDIKIFTKSKHLFTTVDEHVGLRVWNEVNSIYTYKHNDMFYHDTSSAGTIASISDYSIRMFDVKQRYSFNSYRYFGGKKCVWKDDSIFYAFNAEGITKFDIRNGSRELFAFVDIKDLIHTNESIYFIQERNNRRYLMKSNCNLLENFVSKPIGGKVLCKLDRKYNVIIGGDEEIEFIGKEDICYKNDQIGIVNIITSHDNHYFLGTTVGLIRFNIE